MNCDTLDYLIPPVRKKCENTDSTNINKNVTGDFRRSKGSTQRNSHDTQFCQSLKAEVGKTLSIDLKKTTDKFSKELEKHNQNIPLPSKDIVKITVIPITTETQASEIVLKRNQIAKQIDKTVGSRAVKNKVLCSPRRRRETYNIRKTSSADLFKLGQWKTNTKCDELSRMTYTKTIINSLNMNQRGRQEKINYEFHDIQVSPKSSRKNDKAVKQECICDDNKINNVLNDMNSRKNRLTVVGRLGINEIDQYVLNCAATINKEPIKINVSQRDSNSDSIDTSENNGSNKTTRATQADIHVCYKTDRLKNTSMNSKNIQCHCSNVKDVATTISQYKFVESTEPKSPLIVISVYPTKDTMEDIQDLGDIIQINHLQESQQHDKIHSNEVKNRPVKQKMDNTEVFKRMSKSPQNRSRSPTLSSKPGDIVKVDNQNIKRRSPSPRMKNFNKDILEKSALRSRSRSPVMKTGNREKSNTKVINQTTQKSLSPDRQDHQRRIKKIQPQKDNSTRNPVIVNTAQTSKVNPFKHLLGETKEINAKKNKIKKAIIEKYTQKMLMSGKAKDAVNRQNINPKGKASSVTINIDGDNERYKVLFLQDKLSTDLSIRKSLKPQNHKTLNNLKIKSNEGSMEKHQWNNSQALDKKSGFNIRDSLEMRHWRDNDNYQNKNNKDNNYEPTIKIMQNSVVKHEEDKEFSAPVKHYRGDQCCVPNPTLRDREIRDLLGIKKQRSGKFDFVQEVLPELVGQSLRYELRSEKCARSSSSVSHKYYYNIAEPQNKINVNDQPKFVSTWTQCEENSVNSYKQMILNRNIQVFLQLEQFTKQKPIILSRKQYEKVKKTIQKKAPSKISQEKRKLNNSTKCSVVSIGEIRQRRKQQILNVKISKTIQAEHNFMHKQKDNEDKFNCDENKPLLLHPTENSTKCDEIFIASPREVVSSTEIQYASLAHLRHVQFSSSNIKSKLESDLCLKKKDCPSIQTIFKGHKKCVTPNLGTSAYSLYSDNEINNSDHKYNLHAQDGKSRKPFLRRLMSCLVMRSNRASEAILPHQYEQPSMMNSFDSYHINTSLGAIELTSSLYDTSASFYSNHTILPIARMKKGFFSSVRGFLTNLKSR